MLDFALENRLNTVGSRVEWSSVFFPDKARSLLVAHGVAVNMRTLSILGILLYSYILTLACRECFIKSLSKSQHMDIIREFPTHWKETETPSL